MKLCLEPTAKFSRVHLRTSADSVASFSALRQPYLTMTELWHLERRSLRRKIVLLLRRHGFLIVRGSPALTRRTTHCTEELERFFSTASTALKETCVSRKVYANERGVPMWFLGYELQAMRECLRLHTETVDAIPWPEQHFPSLRPACLSLVHLLQRVCDRMLSVLFEEKISGTDMDDYSVCYSFHYPNHQTSDSELPMHVGEHKDPSLFVAEPVARIPGLEVLEEETSRWIQVEQSCTAFSDLVIFGGKALAKWTQGTAVEVPALRHRVVGDRLHRGRVSIVFEQKYGEFYDPSAGYQN